MKVMILAAGRGERLRPITDDLPKPLVEVAGFSLIAHHLRKLEGCEVVINHAWLGHKIEAALGDGHSYGCAIQYSPEPEGGLETAGGIVQALPLLSDGVEPFVVVNGDVFSDFDLRRLLTHSLEPGKLGHLVLVPTPSFKAQGDFGLANHQVLPEGKWTFSGISILHPDLFKGLPNGKYPLAPILRQAMSKGLITGEVFEGYWSDIGTLERLEAAQAHKATASSV
ncbi:N-acetylmuramate alpha-1-phosphate uridylyltransferase MurU [Thiosulfativibrio zosterae]|uniref:Mannose-1-phosphate guanylyltransferase n=1 Tax=Thiosulfativibrio zosterae TaxID=2675053 RepID=A0A6F8PLM7_9GAMM|nr:nucleotidyltransferase family protein [Thiosulfativibrio zosterae]BBP43013.1 mannose-1-phosphate guanylyltransferase [Thiosulfativibrio zosterae]